MYSEILTFIHEQTAAWYPTFIMALFLVSSPIYFYELLVKK